MLNLALQFHNNVGNAPEYTLPIIEDTVEYMYKGYGYGLVAFPTEPQDQRTIDAFLGKAASPKPIAPSGITVSVLDGTDSPDIDNCGCDRIQRISATRSSAPERRPRSAPSRRPPCSTPPGRQRRKTPPTSHVPNR